MVAGLGALADVCRAFSYPRNIIVCKGLGLIVVGVGDLEGRVRPAPECTQTFRAIAEIDVDVAAGAELGELFLDLARALVEVVTLLRPGDGNRQDGE